MIETIGYFASFCCVVAFFPQVLKAFRTRQTRDISVGLLVLLLVGNLLWILYSIPLNLVPILVTNLAISVQVLLLLILKMKFK